MLEIKRSVDELKQLAEDLMDPEKPNPEWSNEMALVFGGAHVTWPLLVHVPEYIAEDAEVTPLDVEHVAAHLAERLEFFIEKAENERGLSAPKALEQVNMLLWVLGEEKRMLDFRETSFEVQAKAGKKLQAWLKKASK